MLKPGVTKTNYHFRDWSYERTFGAVSPIKLPDEYNADLGLSFPNQNKDGYPNGCTGYTTSELGQDENGVAFDPAYTYEATLAIDNLPPGSPCKIRTSLGSAKTYGLKRTDGQPNLHRGSYFDVDKVGDYFDGIRSALYKNKDHKRSISAASPWFSEWIFPKDGILKAPKRYVWDSKTVGHNYKICGWKTIKGEPYLILKPWSGPGFGDGGYVYMSREICNKTFNISGCALYIQTNMVPGEIERVKLDILELILAFYRRLQRLI